MAGGDVVGGDGDGVEGWTSIPTLLISGLSAEMLDSRPGGDVDGGLSVDGVDGEGWTSIPTLLISSLSAEMLDSRPGCPRPV